MHSCIQVLIGGMTFHLSLKIETSKALIEGTRAPWWKRHLKQYPSLCNMLVPSHSGIQL